MVKPGAVVILIGCLVLLSGPRAFALSGGSFQFGGEISVTILPEQSQSTSSNTSGDPSMEQNQYIEAISLVNNIQGSCAGNAAGSMAMISLGGGTYLQEQLLVLSTYKGLQSQMTTIKIGQEIDLKLR